MKKITTLLILILIAVSAFGQSVLYSDLKKIDAVVTQSYQSKDGSLYCYGDTIIIGYPFAKTVFVYIETGDGIGTDIVKMTPIYSETMVVVNKLYIKRHSIYLRAKTLDKKTTVNIQLECALITGEIHPKKK